MAKDTRNINNNLPGLQLINDKYFYNVENELFNYVKKYLNGIIDLETLIGKDDLTVKIESVDQLDLEDIETYYTSLFDANSSSIYLLSIKKIIEFLKNCQLKELVNEKKEISDPINYEKIENYITNNVKEFINDFKLPLKFDYVLNMKQVELPALDTKAQRIINNLEIINEENIKKLANIIISKMPLIKKIIDTYGLLSVQQIDFSLDQYISLKDCFVKIKNSRIQKIDINSIIKLIEESDTNDYEDIFSENYITFVSLLLEASYFLCDYYITKYDEELDNTRMTHKDETNFKNYIIDNIEIYLDKLGKNCKVDFLELYISIYNKLLLINKDTILKELQEC